MPAADTPRMLCDTAQTIAGSPHTRPHGGTADLSRRW